MISTIAMLIFAAIMISLIFIDKRWIVSVAVITWITYANGEVIRTGKLYPTDRGWHFKKGNTPQTAWYHPLAVTVGEERNPEADKVLVLNNTDLVHLFFDDKPQTNRNLVRRKHRALKCAKEMHTEGAIVLEQDAICQKFGKRGYRILEPSLKAIVIAN